MAGTDSDRLGQGILSLEWVSPVELDGAMGVLVREDPAITRTDRSFHALCWMPGHTDGLQLYDLRGCWRLGSVKLRGTHAAVYSLYGSPRVAVLDIVVTDHIPFVLHE